MQPQINNTSQGILITIWMIRYDKTVSYNQFKFALSLLVTYTI